MKEQLVSQLKTQIVDLERFINYLQGEVSAETLSCTCACPIHDGASSSYGRKSETTPEQETRTKTLSTVRKVITLLHMFVISQLGCGSEKARRTFSNKKNIYSWRDLRTRLDLAVEHVLENACGETVVNDHDYSSDSDSPTNISNVKLTSAVRKHLAIAIRDLIQHGLVFDAQANSVVPFIGCFPQKNSVLNGSMHAWELILKYYEIKNGNHYNSSPAQKLSQSFNLDLIGSRGSSSKQVYTFIYSSHLQIIMFLIFFLSELTCNNREYYCFPQSI